MDLLRDLVRDLVGIIFPGSFLVLLIFGAILGISIIFQPMLPLDKLPVLSEGLIFFILLVFSYIAGLMLRIQTLNHLEMSCTENYRRRILMTYRNRCVQAFRKHRFKNDKLIIKLESKKGESEKVFNKRMRKIDKLEKRFINESSFSNQISILHRKYYNQLLKGYKEIGIFDELKDFIGTDYSIFGKSEYILTNHRFNKSEVLYEFEKKFNGIISDIDNCEKSYHNAKSNEKGLLENLKSKYRQFSIILGAWEEFPYFYRNKAMNAFRKSNDYIKFYEKYEKQGITNNDNFFHFCKSAIYKYDESFKEEVLRQESLVRLLAGMYYSIRFGIYSSVFISFMHIGLLLFKKMNYKVFSLDLCLDFSGLTVLICLPCLIILLIMKKRIIKRLRFMRNKELNLAFDGFYLIGKEKDL